MSVDFNFIKTRSFKELKEDKNLTFKKSDNAAFVNTLSYKDSAIGIYSDFNDGDYLSLAKLIGKDPLPILTYLWTTYGILFAPDTKVDPMEYFIAEKFAENENEETDYICHLFAKTMIKYGVNDDKIREVLNNTKDGFNKVNKRNKEDRGEYLDEEGEDISTGYCIDEFMPLSDDEISLLEDRMSFSEDDIPF